MHILTGHGFYFVIQGMQIFLHELPYGIYLFFLENSSSSIPPKTTATHINYKRKKYTTIS
ncbi:hypothetical protein HanIR_Chr13g0627531 [Helianthus annuus]|nr:hypothetical protein HanIR_Chr13g0627531 [Helianthus annuus]